MSACGPGRPRESDFEADHFISTAPLRAWCRRRARPRPAGCPDGGEEFGLPRLHLVAPIIDREALFPDNWLYIHAPDVKVGRIQNFNNWSAALVPEPAAPAWAWSISAPEATTSGRGRRRAEAIATRELSSSVSRAERGGGLGGVRVPEAYPIYDSTYRGLEEVREFLDPMRTCIPSAGTACTSTTIRTTRCMRPC